MARTPGQGRELPEGTQPLPRAFYARSTLAVTRDLVGALLVRRLRGGHVLAGRIVEVEAYIGEDDPACHAFRGLTPRTRVMYGAPGHAYVYFVYGMHYMLNVVTEREGFPAAVLLRAVEPLTGIEDMRRRRGPGVAARDLARGPGRLCTAFGIDRRLNARDLTAGGFFIAPRSGRPLKVAWSERVGIREGRERPWRCYQVGSRFVSKSGLRE